MIKFTATKTTKTSRDGKTITRIITVTDEQGNEVGRRTSKTTDYVAVRVVRDGGSIISAHKTREAAKKAQMAGEYGFDSGNALVLEVVHAPVETPADAEFNKARRAIEASKVDLGLTPERKAELVDERAMLATDPGIVRRFEATAEAAAELDLHEQWRQADRMARLLHRRARQSGKEGDRKLAAEQREYARRTAQRIMEQGGEHPRKLRWR